MRIRSLPTASLLACLICLACITSAPAAQTAPKDPFARLFGYEALVAGQEDFPLHIKKYWLMVIKAERDAPCLQGATCLQQLDAVQWRNLAGKARTMDETELLRAVNAFCNKYPAGQDEKYGHRDRWPIPADLFDRRAGDAKAFALAKYFALRALNIPEEKLRIVLAYLPERKAAHAVLAAATNKGVFILDNDVRPLDLVLPQDNFLSRYIPLLMFNEKGRWTFGQNMEVLGVQR